ncbi:MAG: Dabb family protein [Gemmatimonadota bacterium]
MIHHTVLFRFVPEVRAEQLEAAREALLGMPKAIPFIRGIAFGPNLAPSADTYSHVLEVQLDDMAAVNAYLEHPEHNRVVSEYIHPIRESRLAVDLEV